LVSAFFRNILFLTEGNQDNEVFPSLGKSASSFPWLSSLGILPELAPIRDIRIIRGFEKIPNFPRNLRPNFRLYIRERLKMTFQDEKPKKAKTRKGN
jgi:hypothetical protein